jgi:hypothetical protein
MDPEQLEALSAERCARVSGFSLHANVAMPARPGRAFVSMCGASSGGQRALEGVAGWAG